MASILISVKEEEKKVHTRKRRNKNLKIKCVSMTAIAAA